MVFIESVYLFKRSVALIVEHLIGLLGERACLSVVMRGSELFRNKTTEPYIIRMAATSHSREVKHWNWIISHPCHSLQETTISGKGTFATLSICFNSLSDAVDLSREAHFQL